MLTYCPGLGQWLACSPVSDQTRVRDPVEAYVNCSSLLWYNLIARVRPCLMNYCLGKYRFSFDLDILFRCFTPFRLLQRLCQDFQEVQEGERGFKTQS